MNIPDFSQVDPALLAGLIAVLGAQATPRTAGPEPTPAVSQIPEEPREAEPIAAIVQATEPIPSVGLVLAEALPRNGAEWLTISETCTYLSISRSTWERMRRTGQLPPNKKLPTGGVRIRRVDLEGWADSLPEVA